MKRDNRSRTIDGRAQDPYFWLVHAKQLDKAAMLIWAKIRQDLLNMSQLPAGTVIELERVPFADLGGVFWLNAGLALENLLKGIIIGSRPDSVVEGRISSRLKTHDLLRLAKCASIELSVIDAFFLQIGTQCVTWAGRYPSSLRGGESQPPVFSEADVIAYRSLFERLVANFEPGSEKRVAFRRLT